jgi:hypothetical protein
MAADARGDARLHGANPAAPPILVGDVRRRELGHLQEQHAARDVVAAAGLDHDVFGHGHAAHGNAIAQVRVGHEVETDHAGVGRGVGGLLPQRLVGLREQGRRQERVDLDAHGPHAREHVVVVGEALDALAERHGSGSVGGAADTSKVTVTSRTQVR